MAFLNKLAFKCIPLVVQQRFLVCLSEWLVTHTLDRRHHKLCGHHVSLMYVVLLQTKYNNMYNTILLLCRLCFFWLRVHRQSCFETYRREGGKVGGRRERGVDKKEGRERKREGESERERERERAK